MKLLTVLIFFTICVLWCTIVSGARRKDKVKCSICPDTSRNFTGNALKAKFQELVVQIWNQEIPLTNLGRRFRRIVLDLNENGTPQEQLHIIIGSVMFNNFSPFMSMNPDACVMAAMANGTLSCHVDRSDVLLLDALSQLLNRFPDINYDNMVRMIMSAGCDYQCYIIPPDAVVNRKYCYQNGFVYPIREYWGLPRPPFNTTSRRLRNIIFQMYDSDDFVDNFIAASLTFSLSDVVHRLWAKRNPNFIIEAIDLEFSKVIDSKCCYSRITRAERIREFNNLGAVRSISSEKITVGPTHCFPQK